MSLFLIHFCFYFSFLRTSFYLCIVRFTFITSFFLSLFLTPRSPFSPFISPFPFPFSLSLPLPCKSLFFPSASYVPNPPPIAPSCLLFTARFNFISLTRKMRHWGIFDFLLAGVKRPCSWGSRVKGTICCDLCTCDWRSFVYTWEVTCSRNSYPPFSLFLVLFPSAIIPLILSFIFLFSFVIILVFQQLLLLLPSLLFLSSVPSSLLYPFSPLLSFPSLSLLPAIARRPKQLRTKPKELFDWKLWVSWAKVII